MRNGILLLLVCALALAAGCGRDRQLPPLPSGSVNGLPSIDQLSAPDSSRRISAATSYELIDQPLLDDSGSGSAVQAAGTLTLDPSLTDSELAFGIFALDGFPTDGSIDLGSVTVWTDEPCWVAVANFETMRWELLHFISPAEQSLLSSTELISPDGVLYIAAIAAPHAGNPSGAATLSKLIVLTSSEVPGYPVPNLKTHSALNATGAGLDCNFSALGSDPGDAAIEYVRYDFGDGSPVETSDLLTEVTYQWPSNGLKQVELTLRNANGRTSTRSFNVSVYLPNTDLLVVYNSDIPESQALAEYYASVEHGRILAPGNLLGLPLGATETMAIARADYGSQIRNPIRDWVNASGQVDSLKYILLCKGVPHQIPGSDEFSTDLSTFASVDSELCLLFSDPPLAGWVWNGANFQGFEGEGFYAGLDSDADQDFAHGDFMASTSTGTLPLDYLVGRLSAYTWAEARALVDRSVTADMGENGWALLDSIPARAVYDTMVDPVWPTTNDSEDSGIELLQSLGFDSVFADVSDITLEGDLEDGLPAGAAQNVIANVGWGVNHGGDGYASGADYILNDLQFTYLPGAMWMSYESFNATDFNDADGIDRRGQGQICDFLREGGTVAIGNAYEPFTIGVGDERIVMFRYLSRGDRWIEAAYKGLRLLSWQQVVVGDPLCTVSTTF